MSVPLPDSLREQEYERPVAVFFDPGSCFADISLLDATASFREDYADLFIKDFAVLGQAGGARDTELPFSESLIVDTSGITEDSCLWELSQAQSGSRKIWQVSYQDGEDSGVYYHTDSQGVLRTEAELDTYQTHHIGRFILASLYSGYVRRNVERKSEQRSTGIIKLGTLYADLASEKKIERQREALVMIGFGSLQPYSPPETMHSQGFVSEEGRLAFLKLVEQTTASNSVATTT